MKKLIKLASTLFCLLLAVTFFVGCNSKADDDIPPATPPVFKVSTSISKVNGGVASVNQNTTKFAFDTIDDDAGKTAARVALFGAIGEIDLISINFSGTVSVANAEENLTDMGGWLTDLFLLQIKLPSTATKLEVTHGLPEIPLTGIGNNPESDFYFANNYFNVKVQWLLANGDGSNLRLNTGFVYLGFTDEENQYVAQYFIRVAGELTFID